MTGGSITDAIVLAMKEAIARRRAEETPQDTAARLREKYGVLLNAKTRRKLPRKVFDDVWGDNFGQDG